MCINLGGAKQYDIRTACNYKFGDVNEMVSSQNTGAYINLTLHPALSPRQSLYKKEGLRRWCSDNSLAPHLAH